MNLNKEESWDTETLVVLVTAPSAEAQTLATKLLEAKLIACANILPSVLSIYSWKGETTVDQESLLVMKTRNEIYGQLEAKIKELHSYEVPEILALSVEKGSKAYLDWVKESLEKGGE